MADLQQFISDITVDKKQYCVVCFRTENERKLVTPVALAEFVKLSRLEKLSKRESACIYCEKQAEIALKLYKAVAFARQVNQTLWSLVDKKMSPRGIAYLLPSKVRGQFSGPGSVKRNKLLAILRKYQTFAQTDVLVVDATVPNAAGAEISSEAEVSIVIEDDDERPPVPRLVPIEKLLENPPQNNPTLHNSIEAMTDLKGGSIVLYPVKTTSSAENQFLIIPEGANVQIDGNALNVMNNGPIPVLLPNGNIVAVQPNSNQLNAVEEIRSDNRKIGDKVMMIQNNGHNSNIIQFTGNNQQANGNQVIHFPTNKEGAANNAVIFRNNDLIQNTSVEIGSAQMNAQMCHITNLRSEQICQIADCRSEDVSDGSDMCQISDLRSLHEVERPRQPEAKKKSDPNIDWEDKIPMDVISFMDANDPNAPKLRSQPPAPPPSIPHKPPTIPHPPPTIAKPHPPPSRLENILKQPPDTKKPKILNSSLEYLTPKRYRSKKRREDDDLIVIN